jgi:N-acetyl-anhydromuramyl-L-alanine amidase AmpD
MIIRQVTPWLPHRDRNNAPELIVLHATAGSTAASSIAHLRSVGLSYHYIIARDEKDSSRSENATGNPVAVFHCVPVADHAFHTGSTIPAPSGHGINKASVSISLANIQRRTNPESYPSRQIEALHEVIELIVQQAPTVRLLTTHAVVQPWNRADPLAIDGKAIAERHGLTWWEPTAQQVKAHRPKKP